MSEHRCISLDPFNSGFIKPESNIVIRTWLLLSLTFVCALFHTLASVLPAKYSRELLTDKTGSRNLKRDNCATVDTLV